MEQGDRGMAPQGGRVAGRRPRRAWVIGGAVKGAILGLVLATAGCVTPAPPPPTETVTPVTPAPSTSADAQFAELLASLGKGGEVPVSNVVVSRSASVTADIPQGMSRVGVLLACSVSDTNWKAVAGGSDGRWVGGTCAVGSHSSGNLTVLPSDNGRVQVSITTDRDEVAYVVVFAAP